MAIQWRKVMSKHAVTVLMMVLVSTPIWGEGLASQQAGLRTATCQYEAADCCWDKIDFDRKPSSEQAPASSPDCCWVPLWQE
jgi:hypothetical protein